MPTPLENNTTKIQEILNAVNNLPEGGSETVYKITDNTAYGFPSSAKAGQYVVSSSTFQGIEPLPIITDANGVSWNSIIDPRGNNRYGPAFFVMPSSDVIIKP